MADGETRTVTFVGKDGNTIGEPQSVEYGTAATAPTEDQIPTVEGYKFAGWDKDFSAVKDDITVKAVYHKLCTVTFVDKLGKVLKTQENVEETTAAEPPTAAEVPNVTITDGADAGEYVFNGTWDPDYKSIKDNTTITAQYNKLCTVKFVDKNDNVVDTQSVQTTKDAVDPTTKGITMSNPDGFVWIGWEESFTNIQGDLTVHAKYHTLYDVTFVNYYGETIATVPTEETKAAVAPTAAEVPDVTIKEGEDAGRRLVFNGTWDTDFSNITGAITVKANYNKIFKVTFKDAETYGGSEISVVEVEQGKEATQPDMSAYYSKGFKGWGDAEGNAVSIKNVQSDLTVIALYGSLPADVSFAQDSGLLTDESNVLIYTGTSGQNWDTEGVWYTLEGQVSGWTSGATAVFATDKTVDVASAQTVGKMIFLGQAKKVTFTGEDITFDGAATVQFNASATARFENNILGSAGLVVTAAVETVATDAATTTADYAAALEIAGNYAAGNLTIARAKVKTVGEGTLGDGKFNSETAIKENGVLSLGSTVAQTMSGKITVTKVTINKVDVYQGYVQTEKGSTVTFNADQGNAWELRIAGVAYATGYRTLPTSGTESEIKVLDGGSLVLQSTLGGWGPNSWNGTENKGCLVLTNGLLRLAHENSSGCLLGYVIDGGTVTNEITAAGKGPLLYNRISLN